VNLQNAKRDQSEDKAKGEERHIVWIPKDLSTGVFIYRIRAGDFVQVRKLLLLK
jgi:hypothetical protein